MVLDQSSEGEGVLVTLSDIFTDAYRSYWLLLKTKSYNQQKSENICRYYGKIMMFILTVSDWKVNFGIILSRTVVFYGILLFEFSLLHFIHTWRVHATNRVVYSRILEILIMEWQDIYFISFLISLKNIPVSWKYVNVHYGLHIIGSHWNVFNFDLFML